MCGCSEMPKFFQLGPVYFEPPTSWEIVGVSEEHYAKFLRCRECGTQWFVEEQIERGETNNLQQSWRFEGEPPEAVRSDDMTRDGILGS